jgi:hypothetical protein
MVLTLLNAATAASAIPSTLSDSLKLPTRTDEVSVLVSAECTAGDLSADVQVYGYFPEAAAWYMVASITEQGWAVRRSRSRPQPVHAHRCPPDGGDRRCRGRDRQGDPATAAGVARGLGQSP